MKLLVKVKIIKMKYFKLFFLLNILLLISSCGSLKEGFKNQKKNNSDEFLVEKKSPLVMPPDYNELPVPKSIQENNDNNDSVIESLILNENNSSDTSSNQNLNLEENLLKKIKRN